MVLPHVRAITDKLQPLFGTGFPFVSSFSFSLEAPKGVVGTL
jgi:hypothetical protein